MPSGRIPACGCKAEGIVLSELRIPWPHKHLSPNSRKDRRATTDIRKRYKQTCWALAKEAKFKATHLDITFHPPDGRKRDLDNMLSSCKYGLDGIAKAMGIDDAEFSYTIRKGAPHKPGGVIVIREGAEAGISKAGREGFVPLRGIVT